MGQHPANPFYPYRNPNPPKLIAPSSNRADRRRDPPLYKIDLIINRTLSNDSLSAALTAAGASCNRVNLASWNGERHVVDKRR